MARKADITAGELGAWDKYAKKSANEAIHEIYEHAKNFSASARDWYWKSIKSKRKASWYIRLLSFFLLIAGVVLPLLAAISGNDATTLYFTQFGVVALAVAGLLQGADRIFGWSSGWLRYMTTVTAMEAASRQFELDWANYMITKADPIGDADKRPLFELAKRLEDETSNRQSEETEKWCAEFNNGLALLNDLIKSQRESAEKAVVTARSTAEAQAKSQQLGSIEMTIVHTAGPKLIKVSIDDGSETAFTGTIWSKLHVSPGQHVVQVTTDGAAAQTIQKIVEVPAGGVARFEVKLP